MVAAGYKRSHSWSTNRLGGGLSRWLPEEVKPRVVIQDGWELDRDGRKGIQGRTS